MNKTTILVAGGASAVSLAAGAAGGYFYAKRRFDATLDGLIALEVAKTKKYFSVLLTEAKNGNAKPDDPADIPSEVDEELELEGEDSDEELSEKDLKTIAEGRKTQVEATEALTNYQGYSKQEAPQTTVAHNIFSNAAPSKKPLPPRGPGGKFVPKSQARKKEIEPQLIDERTFLLNEDEQEQKSLLYFKHEDTLIDIEQNNEPVDNAVIGEVNLTLFPEPDSLGESTIYVRNEGLGADYQVKLMGESLTDYIGLGEDPDFDETDAAEHRIAREDDEDKPYEEMDLDEQSRYVESGY